MTTNEAVSANELRMEQVFVRRLPTEEIYQKIKYKLEHREKLTEQELMQMIILPLAEKACFSQCRLLKEREFDKQSLLSILMSWTERNKQKLLNTSR